MRARQGLLDEADLAAHRSDWVDPVSTTYRGVEVFELPFNTQGFVALEMLTIGSIRAVSARLPVAS